VTVGDEGIGFLIRRSAWEWIGKAGKYRVLLAL